MAGTLTHFTYSLLGSLSLPGTIDQYLDPLSSTWTLLSRNALPLFCAPVPGRMQVDGQSLDPPALHLANCEYCSPRCHAISHDRKPAQQTEHETADRRVILFGHVQPEALVEIGDVRRARNEHQIGSLARLGLGWLVLLVENLADDLLEQILHRHEPRCSAILVQHDGEVLLEAFEVGEHFFHFAGARHDVNRPHDRPHVE